VSKTDAIAANDDVIPDFEGSADFADIQSRFIKAARVIMFDYDLVLDHLGERCMRITALELYLHCKNWLDPNTDKHCEQLSSALGTFVAGGLMLTLRESISPLDRDARTSIVDFLSEELMVRMDREKRQLYT